MKFKWRVYSKNFVGNVQNRLKEAEEEISSAHIIVDAIGSQNWDASCLRGTLEKSTPLIQSLISLKDTLIRVNKAEQEKTWITENQALIGGLLQTHQSDLKRLADEVLKKIVQCCDANQGGLFIHQNQNDSDFLELVGMYAYGKKKYETKRIELKEGLVGQVFLEGGMTIITTVPSNYVKITSGLGEATPRCLVIIALEINNQKRGVLELAFFRKPELYQLDFLKSIGESIARSIHWIQESQRTIELLKHSETLSKDLKSQEEELRQNIEEMQAIQEDIMRKNNELENSKNEIERKNAEIEKMNELIESKMETQKILYETQLNKMRKKLTEFQAKAISIEQVSELVINKN